MFEYSKIELETAQKAIESTIRKTKKVQETLSSKHPERLSQLEMVSKNLKVFHIASTFITRELENNYSTEYSKYDLLEAIQVISSIVQQIEKVKPKFKEGTPQHTLVTRRINSFYIASALIESEFKNRN